MSIQLPFCACGCGGRVTKPGNKYIVGHSIRGKTPYNKGNHRTEEEKQMYAKSREINKLVKEGKIELPFCECGCGGRVKKYGHRFIHGHQRRGKHLSEETKQKLRENHTGNPSPMKGKHHTEEAKQKNREAHLGKTTWNKGLTKDSDDRVNRSAENGGKSRRVFYASEEGQRYIEECLKSENHPMYGKHPSDETRQKLSDATSGEKNPMYGRTGEDAPNYGRTGEKASQWKGGISHLPYCEKFDDDLKERVCEFFDRKCYVCGKTEAENGQKLSVHHVNYNKMVCCNDVKPLFVPLCRKCHSKTNKDREYWEEFFTISLKYLTNGECFLPKKNIKEF